MLQPFRAPWCPGRDQGPGGGLVGYDVNVAARHGAAVVRDVAHHVGLVQVVLADHEGQRPPAAVDQKPSWIATRILEGDPDPRLAAKGVQRSSEDAVLELRPTCRGGSFGDHLHEPDLRGELSREPNRRRGDGARALVVDQAADYLPSARVATDSTRSGSGAGHDPKDDLRDGCRPGPMVPPRPHCDVRRGTFALHRRGLRPG